ncbi:hypothetical protein E8E14_006759 [Neopestalotiopsis sp. 37M]|nr:hypothetical protein E8E14_006759 [Neopestalotiopsis sp. 37M]
MASIPRQVETYACDLYQDAGQLVERAAHIVLTCRLSSDMSWQQKPSTSDMLVSVMLSMAAHYAEWAHIGWAYASEATHAFRGLELYRREAHINLTVIESELCKRAFWIMYIMQIHDRLSHITPHTSLCYEPMRTDWNFMLPIEASDFDLGPSRDSGTNTETYHGRRPIIYGFIALIRTFLLSTTPGEATATSSRNEALLAVVSNLQSVLGELPDGLRLSSRSSTEDSPHVEEEDTSIICHQYAIMRVNIHAQQLIQLNTGLQSPVQTQVFPDR